MSKTILVVEDEALVGLAMQDSLERHGYRVPEIIDSGDEVLGAVQRHKPDLILMDIRINSFIDGVDAAKRLAMISDIPLVYITAHSDPATKQRAKKTRPAAYLSKPVDEQTLINTVRALI